MGLVDKISGSGRNGILNTLGEAFVPALREKMELSSNMSYPRSYTLYINPGEFHLNPGEKLINEIRTKSGKVFQHWVDNEYRNDDLAVVEFSGVSGNVKNRSVSGLVSGNLHGVSSNLLGIRQDAWAAFHRLQQMTREPAFYTLTKGSKRSSSLSADGGSTDGGAGSENYQETTAIVSSALATATSESIPSENSSAIGSATLSSLDVGSPKVVTVPNVQQIYYKSPAFKDGITFKGHYRSALDFSESATTPFLINYSFAFVVEESDPPLHDLLSISTLFKTLFGDAATLVEEFGRGNVLS